jgi:hypothetical protein
MKWMLDLLGNIYYPSATKNAADIVVKYAKNTIFVA